MNSNIKDLNSIKHIFSEGQDIWFSCLIPNFDWFEKVISIEEIVEPVKTKIIKHNLMPDQINNDDKFLIKKSQMSDIVRKYKLSLTLDINFNFKIVVYERRNKEVLIIVPEHYQMANSLKDIEYEFDKNVIETKAHMNEDDETTFKKDENYDLFKKAYKSASDKLPEEVIKAHDTNKSFV